MKRGGPISITGNCAISSRYVVYLEGDNLFRALLLPDGGIFTRDSAKLRGGGRVVAVGEHGTAIIASKEGVVVWHATGEMQRLRLKNMVVSVVPPLAFFENVGECVKGPEEWVVFHDSYRWRVRGDRIIQDSVDGTKRVIEGERSFPVRIEMLDFAPNGWVGAMGTLVGVAYPEYDVIVGEVVFPQPINYIYGFPFGVSVIAGHRAFHALWSSEGNRLLPPLSQWEEGGEAHEVVWNDRWIIQLLRGTKVATLSWFYWD